MSIISKTKEGITITLEAVALGNDLNISLYGGDEPHIGAVALAIPRTSLADPQKISASVSVLTITGHKEDDLARSVANKLSSTLNKVTVVSCGIHVNQMSLAQLQILSKLVDACVDSFIKNNR